MRYCEREGCDRRNGITQTLYIVASCMSSSGIHRGKRCFHFHSLFPSPLSLTLSHSHSNNSLSPFNVHIHTFYFFASLSLTHTHSSFFASISLFSLIHTHIHTLFFSLPLSLDLSHTQNILISLALSPFDALTHTHPTFCPFLSDTHTFTRSFFSPSFFHTHEG